jgi:hypothetical protein
MVDFIFSSDWLTLPFTMTCQGRSADAEKAFAEYLSTQTAKQLGSIINSCRYLMATGRYEEAARRHMNGDVILDTSYTGGSRFVMTLGL